MPDNLKRFAKDTSWAFISLAVAAIVQFFLRVLLARHYGAGDLGLYTIAFSIYSFGLIFSGFGIDSGLVKFTAENEGNSSYINTLVTSGVMLSLITGCLIGLILYLSASYIANYFFHMPELTILLKIISIAFPFIALEKATLGFLNGMRRMKLFAFINIAQNGLVFILTLIFTFTGHDIKFVVISLVVPVILVSFISLIYIYKSIHKLKLLEHFPIIKMLFTFGLFVVLANTMGTIMTYISSTILGHYLKDIDVGIYATAGILIQAISLPPSAIQRISGPMIASYWGKNEINNIENLVNVSMKYTAFYAILSAFILGFLSKDFIRLFFGGEFLSASTSLQILLVGIIFNAIQISIGSALSSTAYVKMIFRLTIFSVLFSLILNVLLIPRFGIIGAAIATSATNIFSSLIMLYFMQRLIKITIDWIWFVKLFGVTALIVLGTYGLTKIFNHYAIVVVALTVLIIIMFLYFTTNKEKNYVRRILHLPLGK
jgi:O-antigen/teichoic acid export membrane protein